MKPDPIPAAAAELADDVCSLSLARRMAALLGRDPQSLRTGDALPRGWHVMLFNPPTPQRELRPDGAAVLGFTLPDLGLPRLMMGGRRISFHADIPIGAAVVRESRLGPVVHKEGRTGPFALVDVEHKIRLGDSGAAAVTETTSYVLRPASETSPGDRGGTAKTVASVRPDLPPGAAVRIFVPDEPMLFRYSAITDNPHRIHYDRPYATQVEGYPALVVNGSLPQMILLDMFRASAGREPDEYASRNRAPLYCGSDVTLAVEAKDNCFALTAYAVDGKPAIEAEAW